MKTYYSQNKIIVRDSTVADVLSLAYSMRPSDRQEIYDSHHHGPQEALDISLKHSALCFTVENNGDVVAMFGACPDSVLGDSATVWMLSSPGLDRIRRRFARRSKFFIDFMLSIYPYLENYVSVKNTASIKWLKMCGAKFMEPKPYGLENQMFMKFWFSLEK